MDPVTRRTFLMAPPSFGLMSLLALSPRDLWASELTPAPQSADAMAAPAAFPQQSAALVRETVGVCHGNYDRTKELVEAHPALAKAAIDWGFGDWESALGAAAHTGSRKIAELLIEHGARPNIFSAAMMGQLDVVKAFVETSPGVQRIPGPHGITLLAHARHGGEQAQTVLQYLESVGDADIGPKNVPLPEGERKKYLGRYTFGQDGASEFEIVERRGILALQPQTGPWRGLIYKGNHEFHPAGAEAVRIRFELKDARARTASVIDHGVLVKAEWQSPGG